MKFSNPFLNMRALARNAANQGGAATVARPVRFVPRPSLDTGALPMQDKTMLLRPLNDEHLLEVYKEAKAMNLSDDFIRLIEDAMRQRNLEEGDALHE